MEQNTNLVSFSRDEWQLLKEQAHAAIASGFLPRHITKPEQAVIIAMKGRELGVPFMQSMASIVVIQGKPALSAELMLALIYKNLPGATVDFVTPSEKSHLEAEVIMQRPHGKPQKFKFTIEDAKRAGLLSNPSWSKYPSAMLRARVVSAGARAVFPDAIMGCYTPEELGAAEEPDDELPIGLGSTNDSLVALPVDREREEKPPPQRAAPQNRINDKFLKGAGDGKQRGT